MSYVLRITDIEPLRYGLIFERFLNRERVQMPDIDIDFDDRGRDRVLTYVQEKYGRDRVAQIITFGTMAARAAIRDVGRVLNVPLPDVDRLAKLVPQVVSITLERALSESRELRELYEHEDWARQRHRQRASARGDLPQRVDARGRCGDRLRAARQYRAVAAIDGRRRHRGHAVRHERRVADRSAEDRLPRAVQPHRHRGCRRDGARASRASTSTSTGLPLDDAKTYELLCKADTHGIFQLEATFAKRILIDMQPEVPRGSWALRLRSTVRVRSRAAPPRTWMRRKRGEEPVTYMLPELEPILKETYGAILYQDQVMKIASAVAGFTLGEADILRAAMGKKDKVKMAKQREQFLSGAAARGVAAETALSSSSSSRMFAGYGFNGAHCISYGLIAYQTAYLKANYPREYMMRAAQQPRRQLRQAEAIDPRRACARPGRPPAGCQPQRVSVQPRR